MRLRHGLIGALTALVFASVVLGKPGVVITKDGNRFEGDVTERDDKVDIISRGTTVTVKKVNVQTINYTQDLAEQYKQRLAQLPKNDLPDRIALAQDAMDNHLLDFAQEVLNEALTLDPNNVKAQEMLQRVQLQVHPRVAATEPAPATAPAAAGPPASGGPPVVSNMAPPKRMVTAAEINRIRQLEWQGEQRVRVRVDPDVVKQFLSESGMSPADFNQLTPAQKGWTILTQGGKKYAKGVHILSDPAAIEEFRKKVQRTISGCSATNCHGAEKGGNPAGNFALFPSDSEPATYSNFLILNTYAASINKVKYLMVNRDEPLRSLLLPFLLPPDLTDLPHPKSGYRGALRGTSDPRYNAALTWIRDDLNPVTPNYDIDLSSDPKEPEKGAAP